MFHLYFMDATMVYLTSAGRMLREHSWANITDGRLARSYSVRRGYRGASGKLVLDSLGDRMAEYDIYVMANGNVTQQLTVSMNITCRSCSPIEFAYVSIRLDS